MKRNFSNHLRLVVVKVGTSLLTSGENRLGKVQIGKIVTQILALLNQGIKVILVTSGAIGAGMGKLKLKNRPSVLPQLQAAAAVGQSELMKFYDFAFKKGKRTVAQILLTADDFSDRRRYLNTKNTLLSLLKFGALAIINENDTISVDEIKFGDNDKLSAQVANLIGADLLVILSDVDGLYDQKKKRRIATVEKIDSGILSLAQGTKSSTAVGGMVTKIEAARITTASGIPCVVANGKTQNVLSRIVSGEDVGTFFPSRTDRLGAKKCWIVFSTQSRGKIIVDRGAKNVLIKKGKSLLPSGIIALEGKFKAGDIVSVADEKRKEFAKGISNYSAAELEKIKGCHTRTIASRLGYKYYDEVIHCDNLCRTVEDGN